MFKTPCDENGCMVRTRGDAAVGRKGSGVVNIDATRGEF
jgi:hypothetical protein